MNWKKFKNLFINQKKDETCFIIGIDLGNSTSAIAYFDVNNNEPEIIDISGGYGKPSVPTVMQYIYDTKEWVFGEYALLNRSEGKDITLSSLMAVLGRREYVEIEQKPVSVVSILGMYLKELLANLKSINPKAEIAGIIASIPSYLGEDAKEELLQAFNMAGYEKEVIALVADRECIFSRHFHGKKVKRERVLLLDYGSRELRGGVYNVEQQGDVCKLQCLSSRFDDKLGTDKVDDELYELMTGIYCRNMNADPRSLQPQTKDHLKTFVYQHKDLIFQKTAKPIRLYFNFAYPPFQDSLTKDEIARITRPFKHDAGEFIDCVLAKNTNDDKISAAEIDTIICTGGGFEMMWAREVVENIFPDGDIVFYKNSKCVVAEGAAVIAAKRLDVIDAPHFATEDRNQMRKDIGLIVTKDRKNRFIPLIERNSFWWQYHEPRLLLINDKTDKPIDIKLFERDAMGEMKALGILRLDDLPERPRGVTRVKISLQLQNYNEIEATLTDCGFGELFPAEEYERSYIINL